MFDIKKLTKNTISQYRYNRQLDRMRLDNKSIDSIEKAVEESVANIKNGNKSFVIYGEPQSGKTEMMITMTARLLDEGFKMVIVLLNDSVQLLNQNLERFSRSGIDPAPKNFSEILDPVVKIGTSEWIIFCKKNSKDLTKLLQKIDGIKNKVIIDDEADYASPNAKVNKGEKTKINALIEKLINSNGIYIGVTATPARLDLNNTFMNENERWIDFPPHPRYSGQKFFFPTSIDNEPLLFDLVLLPNQYDDPKYLRKAIFRFLIKVSYLNMFVHPSREKNYSILIHTSGKRADHTNDFKEVVHIFNVLKNDSAKKYATYYKKIWEIAKELYPNAEDKIMQYIYSNINRNTIIVMNSNTDKSVVDYTNATDPSTLFTVAIGGNIVSRGVTFDNLISMFFTRDVKHKIQQDTYIQRARMFGSRGDYLPYMELHIPENLYLDWHKCFIFHRLSLEAIRAGNGTPVWLEDKRVKSVASSSIDKITVAIDSGEMSFEIFDYTDDVENIISSNVDSITKLENLMKTLDGQKLPNYLQQFIEHFSPNGKNSLVVHSTGSITNWKDADQERIARPKQFLGTLDLKLKKYPNALHHIKIFKNANDKARVFYKYVGNIRFIKNFKKKS